MSEIKLVDETTIYALNKNGINKWWLNVVPGCGDDDKHLKNDDIKDVVNKLYAAHDMYEALNACHEAMSYMSEYDMPITLPEQVKAALAKAEGKQ